MRIFRVFLSSTFADLEREREAFRERVVPALQRLCRANDADFRAVDLRWSISEQAGRDQRTMEICLAEVRRCLAVTPRPNFVVLLRNRYGWRPAPAEVPASLFERIVDACGTNSSLLRRWYSRDDNAVPPVYYLRARQDEYVASDRWHGVEQELVQTFASGAGTLTDLSGPERVMFGGSATEQEIEHGALATDPSDRVFCFFRHIRGELPPQAVVNYFDARGADRDWEAGSRLEALKARLRSTCSPRVCEYEAEWRHEGLSEEHVDQLCRDVRRGLESVIEHELSDPAHKDELQRERERHLAFASGRTRVFVGRTGLLDQIESHTVSASRSPLALIGASGTGKSAVMAEGSGRAVRQHADTCVIHRFAGVTPQSSDTCGYQKRGTHCDD